MNAFHSQTNFPKSTPLIYVVNEKDNDVITDIYLYILYAGKDHITERDEDLQFKISPHAFFQTNPQQALKLNNTCERFCTSASR
jgi:23S rRNA (uracil1939-C5)-methyltransferase